MSPYELTILREGVVYSDVDDAALGAILKQLSAEQIGAHEGDAWTLSWADVYTVLGCPDDFGITANDLGLPPIDDAITLSITREDNTSITDKKFDVRVKGFVREHEQIEISYPHDTCPWMTRVGFGDVLLSEASWNLLHAVTQTRRRKESERNRDGNLEVLAEVRALAANANAVLDVYLQRTRVLRPKELFLDIEENMTPGGKVVTVAPRFEGQPDRWLETFDRITEIRQIYRVTEGEDYCEIIVDPAVQVALGAIKAMVGRRVAGAAAQRLLANPFAYFGPEISEVFNEGNIEQIVAELRRDVCQFIIAGTSEPVSFVDLLIEPVAAEPTITSTMQRIASASLLQAFCRRLRDAIQERVEVFEWRKHQLQIDGDSPDKLVELMRVLGRWTDQGGDDTSAVGAIDLSIYSDRVESIGIETPYSIIMIPRPKHLGSWLPEDELLSYIDKSDPEQKPVPLNVKQIQQLPRLIEEAEAAGQTEVRVPGAPPMLIGIAKGIVENAPLGIFDGPVLPPGTDTLDKPIRPKQGPKPSLLMASNIDNVDYVEQRASYFAVPDGCLPQLPACMRPDVKLLAHQEVGVAWLQHLLSLGTENCRGALLADDMGLGKTIQLLTLVLQHLESAPQAGPALIIAPVTLLENWRMEIARFFDVPEGEILSLYGAAIRKHRAGPGDVDEALFATQRKLLRDGWIGQSRVVLTTYETVRDLEFSLAEVDWSFIICDEAQKIKNPNALLTRAVKKLKARFRVAATGTPVENSLRDLWSLFDFIQPGLLDPLNKFAKEYQRPIEARTPEQKQALERLRQILAPQILRRMKVEVAKDLPDKRRDDGCRALLMSDEQMRLYQSAVNSRWERKYESENERALATINVLQHLRRICCHPGRVGEVATAEMPIDDYRDLSPKFDWLMRTLVDISNRDEKAIVFVEARDIQRQLKIYLDAHFHLDITIINGETSTSAQSETSRQKLIDAYQAKGGFNIIILSPLAAGVGLNIQAANHVVHYMRHWNPAREDQATDRAYRIGQKRDVVVYTPIVCSPDWPSFDQRLDELLEYKRQLANDMYNGADDVAPRDIEGILTVFEGSQAT